MGNLSEKILLSDKLKEFEYLPEMRLLDVEDVKECFDEIKEDIKNAQEDFANLDWISKEQAIEIINKRAGNKLTK